MASVSVGVMPADDPTYLKIARIVARQLTPPLADEEIEQALQPYVERLLAEYPPGVAPPEARRDLLQKLMELTRERLPGSTS